MSRTPLLQVDALWLAVEPVDMRSGADRQLARVMHVFGTAQAHHGYLLTNAPSTRACRRQDCWPTRWSAASLTTCHATGKSRATPARVCTRRARRWSPEPVRSVRGCNRCSMRTRPSCSAPKCCMPTRPRWRCSTPALARPNAPIYELVHGPMRAAASRPCRAWLTTSASVVRRAIPWLS